MELQEWEDEYLPERPLRHFCGTRTVEITTRTIHGRFLLKPSRDADEIIGGVFGRALELHPAVLLHAMWFLSNHYTLLATFPDVETMSSFMGFVNGNLARELGALYQWREKFWSRRYRAIELADEGRGPARLKYLLAQGTKEGLVARPADWPGVSSLGALVDGTPMVGVWFDRTREYRARKRKTRFAKYDFARELPIPHEPLPCWKGLSEEERRRRVREIVAEIEEEAIARNRELGRRPLGAQKILRQDPHDRPERISKSPAPLAHASNRDHFFDYRQKYLRFVLAFRAAAERLAEGIVAAIAEFPADCFLPRLRMNADVRPASFAITF